MFHIEEIPTSAGMTALLEMTVLLGMMVFERIKKDEIDFKKDSFL